MVGIQWHVFMSSKDRTARNFCMWLHAPSHEVRRGDRKRLKPDCIERMDALQKICCRCLEPPVKNKHTRNEEVILDAFHLFEYSWLFAIVEPASLGGRLRRDCAWPLVRVHSDDGNGHLDTEEVMEALKALNVDADMERSQAILDKYDDDKNGTLELDEFHNMCLEILAEQARTKPNHSTRQTSCARYAPAL